MAKRKGKGKAGRTGAKTQSSIASKGAAASHSATTGSQTVYIRVHWSLVQTPTASTTTASTSTVNPPPSIPQPSNHLYLIQGSIDDIRRYAGATADWIIKVAHFICDPSGAGQIYTHRTGTPSDWYNRDRDANWLQVNLGDPLVPGIYEFVTTGPITLSKISDHQSHSVTSLGSESSSTTFRRHIELRDGACVVSRVPRSLIASHLIPKRMGTDGVKEVVTRFVGATGALNIHRFHPEIGVLLFTPLHSLVDNYKLGFYHVTGQTYTLHNFDRADPDLPYLGTPIPLLATPLAPLHMFSVTLTVHGGSDQLPPKGVFNWHYLQCVVSKFGTDRYKNIPNICYFVHPFKTVDDDSEEEFKDDDDEPPYPTYRFDRFMAEQWKKHREQEHRREMAQWSSGVVYGVE